MNNEKDLKEQKFPFLIKKYSDISDSTIKLVTDAGIEDVSVDDAISSALSQKLDLMAVTFKDGKYICKIIDYGKKKYKEKQKKKNKTVVKKNKKIQINFSIGKHDLLIKTNHIEKFLNLGHTVEIIIKMKGRELTHFDKCEVMADEIIEKLAPVSKLNEKKKLNTSVLIILKPNK